MKRVWQAIGICIGVLMLVPLDGGLLEYRREALAAGEYWRLVTAHIVHVSPAHGLLNAVAYTLLLAYFVRCARAGLLVGATVAMAVGISWGLWQFAPDLAWYRGASGVVHGLLMLALVIEWPQHRQLVSLAIVLLLAKVALEPALPAQAGYIDVPVIGLAHRLGMAIAGLLAGCLLVARRFRRRST